MKNKSVISEKSPKELDNFISEQRKALADHAIAMRTKKISNIKQTAAIKKTIAQALTLKRQRQLAQAQDSQPSEGASNE